MDEFEDSQPTHSEGVDINFEHKLFPCYGVKFFKDKDEMQIVLDKKIVKKIRMSSFPKNVDLNDVGTVSAILKLVRTTGCDSLVEKYKLTEI